MRKPNKFRFFAKVYLVHEFNNERTSNEFEKYVENDAFSGLGRLYH